MKKVFIVIKEDDICGCGIVDGVYSTFELALEHTNLKFTIDGWHCKNRPKVIAETEMVDYYYYLIEEYEVMEEVRN